MDEKTMDEVMKAMFESHPRAPEYLYGLREETKETFKAEFWHGAWIGSLVAFAITFAITALMATRST